MIGALYRHRGYIARTAWRDVRHRHVGSAAGAAWNILRPLALIGVFTIVFSEIMQSRGAGEFTGVRFTLYLCSALLPWAAFAETLSRGTHALAGSAAYLRKLAIDEEVFVAQPVVSGAISLAISMGLLLLLSLGLSHGPMWTWLLLPLPLGLLLTMGYGLGLLFGTLFVFVRDVRQIVEIAVHIGFWTVPIVYDPAMVPEWFQATFAFNPVFPYLEATRDLFLHGRLPGWEQWALMLMWPLITCGMGQFVLTKLRGEVRDNL